MSSPNEKRTKPRALTADVQIPYLGVGTYLIANDEAAAAVREAIRAGYRHIDTAEGYQNESGVGAGIKQALQSEGLARGDVSVTTKLWPGNPDLPRREPRAAGVGSRRPLLDPCDSNLEKRNEDSSDRQSRPADDA